MEELNDSVEEVVGEVVGLVTTSLTKGFSNVDVELLCDVVSVLSSSFMTDNHQTAYIVSGTYFVFTHF